MSANKLRLAAAIGLAAVVASGPALSRSLEGFGAPEKAKCWRCEPSGKLRRDMDTPIPEHAIFLDFGNGPFWKNSRAVIVDLDGAEVLTYRFPPDQDRPTKLELVSRNALSPEILGDLLQKAKASWNPPVPKTPPRMISDVFEALYVIDGPTMATWMRGSSDPAWYVALTKAVRTAAAP